MPRTKIRVFRNADGTIPLFEWLGTLEKEEPEAFEKCLAVILALERFGSELRRPSADFLRNGIHELRTRLRKVRFRILYFFVAKNVAVLTHGFSKDTAETPDGEIERAIERKDLVKKAPLKHLGSWETIE